MGGDVGFVVDEAFLVAGPDTYRAHLYANLYIDKSQVRVVAPCLHTPLGVPETALWTKAVLSISWSIVHDI